MRGKQYKRAQLEYIEHLFQKNYSASEVAAAIGTTSAAMRKLRQRMREAGWQVGTGSCAHPMPKPEVTRG